MKVALVHGRYFSSWEALGLGYIGSYLKAHRPDLDICFFQGCFDEDEQVIRGAAGCDLVGFSCTSPTFAYGVRLARAIKKLNPEARTVVGNYHPSAVPQDCLVPGIDQVVMGEGEAAMSEPVRLYHPLPLSGYPAL